MTYTKPQLYGYSALAAIQETSTKDQDFAETSPHKTDPAYQADE